MACTTGMALVMWMTVAAPVRADETFDAARLLPFEPRKAEFRVVRRGEDEASIAGWSRTPIATAGDRPARVRIELTGIQAALLERDADGATSVLQQWDLEKGQWIDYETPAMLLPPQLAMGGTYENESRVVVYDSSDGSVKARGTCVHRIHLIGRRSVETPAGRFDVVRVELRREVDVPVATADVRIVTDYVLDRGRVRQRITQQLGLFGFTASREQTLLELFREQASGGARAEGGQGAHSDGGGPATPGPASARPGDDQGAQDQP